LPQEIVERVGPSSALPRCDFIHASGLTTWFHPFVLLLASPNVLKLAQSAIRKKLGLLDISTLLAQPRDGKAIGRGEGQDLLQGCRKLIGSSTYATSTRYKMAIII